MRLSLYYHSIKLVEFRPRSLCRASGNLTLLWCWALIGLISFKGTFAVLQKAICTGPTLLTPAAMQQKQCQTTKAVLPCRNLRVKFSKTLLTLICKQFQNMLLKIVVSLYMDIMAYELNIWGLPRDRD